MNYRILPYKFIRERASLTWAELLWGYEQGFTDVSSFIELANEKLISGSDDGDEIELAGLTEGDLGRVKELAKRLSSKFLSESSVDRDKWLFLLLSDLFSRRSEVQDPLADVESIYADFDYPVEIEGFIRYMPASDGYDPLSHSHEENIHRLYLNWERYLGLSSKRFRSEAKERPY